MKTIFEKLKRFYNKIDVEITPIDLNKLSNAEFIELNLYIVGSILFFAVIFGLSTWLLNFW